MTSPQPLCGMYRPHPNPSCFQSTSPQPLVFSIDLTPTPLVFNRPHPNPSCFQSTSPQPLLFSIDLTPTPLVFNRPHPNPSCFQSTSPQPLSQGRGAKPFIYNVLHPPLTPGEGERGGEVEFQRRGRGIRCFYQSRRDFTTFFYSSKCITRPLRSFGSNQVDLGGIIFPESAIVISCFIETG